MGSLTGSSAIDQLNILNQHEDPDGKGLKRISIVKLSVTDDQPGKRVKVAVCVMPGQDITSFELRGPRGFKVIAQDPGVTDEAMTDLSNGSNDKWIGYLIERQDIPSPFKLTDTRLKLDIALPVPQTLEWVVGYEGTLLKNAHVKGHSHLAAHGAPAGMGAAKAKPKKRAGKKKPPKKGARGRRSK